ncbi:MAG: thiamine/thiamine pyrophosphate ABC transporter permease ThiP [Paracoccaceae bacterium]
MADRPVAISRAPGISAAFFVAALILGTLMAVALRAEVGAGFGASDWAAVRFTVSQALVSATLSVVLAIPVARALARRQFVGRNVLVTLLGAPFILPVIVAVLGLLAVFGRSGWISQVLDLFGLLPLSIYGFHGVVLAHVFFNLPLATRLILQGWQDIPAERFRLAAQLGFDTGDIARVLERPLLRRVMPGAFAIIFAICLTSFAVALTLGGGPRATTIELAIYQAFRFDFDLGRAALLSCLQIGLAGSAALFALHFAGTDGFGAGLDRPVLRWDVRGGWMRLQDVGAIGGATLFLMLPLSAVVLAGIEGMFALPASVFNAALLSLMVALASTTILLMLALPMAATIAVSRRGLTEIVGLLGIAASPLVIGTGLFLILFPMADPFALALPVTAVVNAIMALPFALRILVPGMRDVLVQYGPLAQSMGMRGWGLWRLLVLPRMRRQIGFAAGLGAALSMGDLGVIALFADPERATLPLQMYRLMGSYQMEAAASAGLLLVLLSLGLFWVFDRGGRRNVDA